MKWDSDSEGKLRAEVEKRFRARTPARTIADGLPEDRVNRAEMLQQYELPVDREWAISFARWYRRMASRTLRELDPEAVERYQRHCRTTPVAPR